MFYHFGLSVSSALKDNHNGSEVGDLPSLLRQPPSDDPNGVDANHQDSELIEEAGPRRAGKDHSRNSTWIKIYIYIYIL